MQSYLKKRGGTPLQAINYVLRTDGPGKASHGPGVVEIGQRPVEIHRRQGKRSDLDNLVNLAKAGASRRKLWDCNANAMIRYHKGVMEMRDEYMTIPETVEVELHYGPAGVGKSHHVMELYKSNVFYCPYGWFDGYDGESVLCLDDYSGSVLKLAVLQNLLDRHVKVTRYGSKGSHVRAAWKTIVITSNLKIEDWYDYKSQQRMNSIMRRIRKVYWYIDNNSRKIYSGNDKSISADWAWTKALKDNPVERCEDELLWSN